jgi:hypothetical protein
MRRYCLMLARTLIWLDEKLASPTISRHGIDETSFSLPVWLDEKLAAPTISRHGKVQASSPLLIWLNEIVR